MYGYFWVLFIHRTRIEIKKLNVVCFQVMQKDSEKNMSIKKQWKWGHKEIEFNIKGIKESSVDVWTILCAMDSVCTPWTSVRTGETEIKLWNCADSNLGHFRGAEMFANFAIMTFNTIDTLNKYHIATACSLTGESALQICLNHTYVIQTKHKHFNLVLKVNLMSKCCSPSWNAFWVTLQDVVPFWYKV